MVGTMAVYFLVTLAIFVAYLGARGIIVFPLILLLPIPIISLVLFVGGIHDDPVPDRRVHARSACDPAQHLTVWFFLVPSCTDRR